LQILNNNFLYEHNEQKKPYAQLLESFDQNQDFNYSISQSQTFNKFKKFGYVLKAMRKLNKRLVHTLTINIYYCYPFKHPRITYNLKNMSKYASRSIGLCAHNLKSTSIKIQFSNSKKYNIDLVDTNFQDFLLVFRGKQINNGSRIIKIKLGCIQYKQIVQ
ncbi:hypothetical protein ABPG72_017853, partial [Tetrahymena utriculariae]